MKRITAMILCAVLVLSTMFGTWSIDNVHANDEVGAQEATERTYGTGLTIPKAPSSAEDQYRTETPFDKVPFTFEATIKMGATAGRSTILGNFGGNTGTGTINFEIHNNGVPRLYYSFGNGSSAVDIKFSTVDVRTDKILRLTIVYNESGKEFICYINGVEKERQGDQGYAPVVSNKVMSVGTDWRVNNDAANAWFKGTIYDVTVWADARTAEEVACSYIGNLDTADENLIAAYDFNTTVNTASDRSGNGYDLTRTPVISEVETPVQGANTTASIEKGMTFGATPLYQTYNQLTHNVVTISSWIQLPEGTTARSGVVFGNYHDSGAPCIVMEIHEKGVPRFYYRDLNNKTTDWQFTGADVRANNWVHLVFVINEDTDSATCYLNGVLQEAIRKTASQGITIDSITNGYVLGGDLRSGNGQYFKGRIKDVALYDEMLTVEQVETLYMDGVDSLSKEPFSYYDVTNGADGVKIPDIKCRNHFVTSSENAVQPEDDRFHTKEEMTDYAYSFAIVGDQQINTQFDRDKGTNYLGGLYKWLVDNKDAKNIQHVFGVGDITNNNSETEWKIAKKAVSQLDGKIPYTLVRGNHDLVGVKESAGNSIDFYTQDIGSEEYLSQFQYGGFYSDDNIWNAWRTFTVGETDYLVLALDFGASDDVLNWASRIVEGHPTHNVIITTHAYLEPDGTLGDDKNECPTIYHDGPYVPGLNTGENMWFEFVSQHKNIVLVMSGHLPSEDIVVRQDKGVHGNTVTSMLINQQYVDSAEWNAGRITTGMVTMLYFSEDGSQIKIEQYSTAKEKYFNSKEEQIVQLNVVDDKADFQEKKVVPYTAEQVQELKNNGEYPNNQDGYLFAGWYTEESCGENVALKNATPNGTVYALFVPDDVLSVKAQISANLIDSNSENNTSGSIRFVTSVDSAQYKEVGFEIEYKDSKGKDHKVTKNAPQIYEKLYSSDGRSAWGATPEGTFSGVSKYFKACTVSTKNLAYYQTVNFLVKPYWITLDGAKVYGLSDTRSIQQGIDAYNNANISQDPDYMVKLSGTYNGNSRYLDVWQPFTGYKVGETYVFSCDYYMPFGSSGSIRFRGSSGGTVAQKNLFGGNGGSMAVEYTIRDGDVTAGNPYFGPDIVQHPGGEGYYWNLRVTKKDSNGNLEEENLLTNSDFAEGDGSWIGWNIGASSPTVTSKESSNTYAANYGCNIVKFDRACFADPEYVAKVSSTYVNNAGETKTWLDIWQSFSDYKAGETYVFTCNYYMPANATGSIRFRSSKGGSETAVSGGEKGSRGIARVEYTVQEGTTYFGPAIVQHLSGEGYYWNLRVTTKDGEGNLAEGNLLKNPNFTEGDGSWIGWQLGAVSPIVTSKEESNNNTATYGPAIVEFSRTLFDEPKYMAKVPGVYANSNEETTKWLDIWQSFADYEAGETYVFTCDYYMPANVTGSIRFRSSNGGKETAIIGGENGSRGTARVEYTVQEGTTYFGPEIVQHDLDGAGYYWNLRVTKKDSDGNLMEGNLLRNPDFTEGNGSWIGWQLGAVSPIVTSKEESDNYTATYGPAIVNFSRTP